MPIGERRIDRLRELLLLVLSAPVKAGAVHRLRLDPEFEARLSEATILFKYLEEAFNKGRNLAKGILDAKSLGLGSLFSSALKDAFDFTEKKPLPGLSFASLSLALIAGYASITGRDVISEMRRLVRLTLYSNPSDETIAMVEGLEAIGGSDYLLALERNDITKRSIRLNALTIGDIAEKLQSIDSGFLYNIKGIGVIREISSSTSLSKNIIEAIIKAYYLLGVRNSIFAPVENQRIIDYMISLEKKGKAIEKGNRLLGGVYLSIGLIHVEKPLPLP